MTTRTTKRSAQRPLAVVAVALLLLLSSFASAASVSAVGPVAPRRALLQQQKGEKGENDGADAVVAAGAPAVSAAAVAPAPAASASPPKKQQKQQQSNGNDNGNNENNSDNFFSTPAAVREVQDSIVTVNGLRSIGLEGDARGASVTDGYVVHSDDDRVIVATDHVGSAVRASPATYTVSFADGASVKAKALYYDPVQDFAFLQFSPELTKGDSSNSANNSPSKRTFKALKLGTGRNLTVGQPLVLIGEQSGVYTRRDGVVSEPRVVSSDSSSSSSSGGGGGGGAGAGAGTAVRTTFERVDSMSGAPVFDLQGRVVAQHSSSADSYSKELPIDYVTTALKALLGKEEGGSSSSSSSSNDKNDNKKKKDDKKSSSSATTSTTTKNQPKRGDLGVELTLLPAGVARRNYKLPADALPATPPADGGASQVIQVVALQSAVADRAVSSGGKEQSPAGGLQPGDIISKADGKAVGDDLFLLDRVLDSFVNGTVPLQVWRNGTEKRLRVPVRDLEAGKLRRFARFGGGVFHELSDESRAKLQSAGAAEGVLMMYADRGTPMARLTTVVRSSFFF